MTTISTMARRLWLLGAATALFVGSAGVVPAHADNAKKTLESLTAMLKEAGLKSTVDAKIPAHILVFEGKGGRKFPFVVAVADDILILYSVIAIADQMTRPAGIEAGLLAANFDYGFYKLVFDKKGSLIFKYDIYESMVDAKDLKKLIMDMVANTNNFYDNAPFIKK